MTSLVAIDFETANRSRASVIQVGVARVIDDVVYEPHSSFVMPPPGHRRFDPSLIPIHGLTPDMVRDAPEWPEVLERIVRFATYRGEMLPLVAHNAPFERSVISRASEAHGLPSPPFRYLCTLKLARAVDPNSPNHKLNVLAERHGVTQVHHHDAGDDAYVCAKLALRLLALPGGGRLQGRSYLRTKASP